MVTRVGREQPQIAATIDAFVEATRSCRAQLQMIEVPHGRHGFDVLDRTDESRKAVEHALDTVITAVT